MLRIAIANDSLSSLDIMRRVILSQPGYGIAWVARDGAEAVRKCLQDPPDLILMDVVLPVMDGVAATNRIMRESPAAILIVTSSVSGNSGKILQAMGGGALDVVQTPMLGPGGQITGGKELLAKIERLSRLVYKPSVSPSVRIENDTPPTLLDPPPLVAIGSSAGGPKALATILGQLPSDFAGAVMVVQHVDGEFALRLAEWLNSQTVLPVQVAEEGTVPAAGSVLVARGDRHLIMSPGMRLAYTPEPRDSSYWPSIDVFFSSVARHRCTKAIAVLLTGMGRDGARGLLDLRRAGWRTIAQDEASSVVYGMPKAAVEIDAACEVLPLSEIAEAIVSFIMRKK